MVGKVHGTLPGPEGEFPSILLKCMCVLLYIEALCTYSLVWLSPTLWARVMIICG